MADDADLLDGAEWWCTPGPPDGWTVPSDLAEDDAGWIAAPVPGTVAAALAEDGRHVGRDELDGQDWWYRCRFTGPGTSDPGHWVLHLGGLATLADVWLNGRHLVRSESMFAAHDLVTEPLAGANELLIRFAALDAALRERRPRPRWKVRGLASQNVRWIRTTLLGRQTGWAETPPPVGPWRGVTLRRAGPVELRSHRVVANCDPDSGDSGVVSVSVEIAVSDPTGDGTVVEAVLDVAGRTTDLVGRTAHGRVRLAGQVRLEAVERWWPHTHGDQPLYPVGMEVAGVRFDLGEVGFRTIEVDRSDGGFEVSVNGVPVFCRGACWFPVDPVGFRHSDVEPEHSLALARTAGMNMLRIPGGTVYEEDRFFRACDRAGILVWQDLMLGPVDPPDDPAFRAVIEAELSDLLDRGAHHPSLAVLCGGQQIEEQPAMFGLPRDRWRTPLLHDVLPDLVAAQLPGLEFVTSSPSGGDLPFEPGTGVSHYYGVGVCLLPLDDLRRTEPRFVTEGLAFSVPPDRSALDDEVGADLTSRTTPDWKRAVHHDPGSWFDLEDVRDHYAASLFAVDVAALWFQDPQRALDLGRATIAEILGTAAAEWRRPRSRCHGMVLIALRDLRPGPGWGLIDASGQPKAPYYVLARAWAPVAVTITDERMNGLDVHLVNDTAGERRGTLRIDLHTGAHTVESATREVVVPARGGVTIRAESVVDGFRDLSYAYHFGPRPFELITAEFVDPSGRVEARGAFLPGGPDRVVTSGVGLDARLAPADGDAWTIHLSTDRFAEYVHIDVPGFLAGDSWFHLPPGGTRDIDLRPLPGAPEVPSGRVYALNSAAFCSISG